MFFASNVKQQKAIMLQKPFIFVHYYIAFDNFY